MIKHGFLIVVVQICLTACSMTPDSDSSVKAQVSDYSAASLMMMGQIVYSNCGDCHYDGNPQNLISFQDPQDFFAKEREIRAQIDSGKMPKGRPWRTPIDKAQLYQLMATPMVRSGSSWQNPLMQGANQPVFRPQPQPTAGGQGAFPGMSGFPQPLQQNFGPMGSGAGGGGASASCGPGQPSQQQTVGNSMASCQSSGNGSSASSSSVSY